MGLAPATDDSAKDRQFVDPKQLRKYKMNYSQILQDIKIKEQSLAAIVSGIPEVELTDGTITPTEVVSRNVNKDYVLGIDNTLAYASPRRVRARIGRFVDGNDVEHNATHYRATTLLAVSREYNLQVYKALDTNESLFTAEAWYRAYNIVLSDALEYTGAIFV